MRMACAVAYDGQRYSGWQRQPNALTVQAKIETALSTIANAPITVQCAGRTDAGVHATYQIIHFDTPVKRNRAAWILGVNTHLPADIRILWAQPVVNRFHARFEALSRQYHYYIDNSPVHSPFYRGRMTWFAHHLDAQRMHNAGQCLRGEHDFSALRASSCQSKSTHRHIFSINVSRTGRTVCVEVTANAFLHHMVRNLVGCLLEMGAGRKDPGWLGEVIASGDRRQAGVTAAPDGLYLTRVVYSDVYGLALPDSSLLGHYG